MDDNDGRRSGNRQKTGTDGKAVNKAVLRKNNPGKKQRQSQQAKVKQKIQRQFTAAVIKMSVRLRFFFMTHLHI